MTGPGTRGERRLRCDGVGHTLVVQPEGTAQPALRAFAASLAADPDHTVVVLGLGGDYPAESWGPVLPVLAASPGSLRLVPGSPALTTAVPVGQWLADQLGRPVLAQDGPAQAAARGALFIPAGAGDGWLRLRPGQAPAPGSRRFPAPWWAAGVLERPTVAGPAAVAEPLPGGAWIRPAAEVAGQDEHRQRLTRWLAWRDDRVYVPLGHPGAPALAVADIARFWRLLPVAVRAAVRFVPYGPVDVPGGGPLGQALATELGERVGVCTGLPWCGWPADDVIRVQALGGDGSPGWQPFATEVSYQPAGPLGDAAQPVVTGHRSPVAGLAEVSPAIYRYQRDIVVEVVQSGLWLRPAAGAPAESVARSHPLAPDEPVIFVGTSAPQAQQLRSLALDLVNSLDPAIRASCRVLPASQPFSPVPAGPPAIRLESGPRREATGPEAVIALGAEAGKLAAGLAAADAGRPPAGAPQASPAAGLVAAGPLAAAAPGGAGPGASSATPASGPALRVQPVPAPEASVVPPSRGITQERAWLRRSMSRQYDAAASSVGRVLAENPGIRSESGGSASDLLTDLVALRLYLSGQGQRLDDAVRAGKAGPHVPFGRCVAAGLRRLPSHRGATRLRATLADAEWQWYHDRQVVTEWSFCSALAGGGARLPGTVEFRIWSMTGRRTSLLESRLPGQVLFLPGTNFKVLRVSSDDGRQVLLRELSANEIGADGRVDLDRVPLDEIALTGLEQAAAAWREAEPGEDLPAGYEHRFGNPPGLIVKVGTTVPGPAAGPPASGQAAV
jgi:hypothetical protein